MKTSKMAKFAAWASLSALAVVGRAALGSPNDRQGEQCVYVDVTGSHIPQKIKIHRTGTLTASPLRVYNRREIDQTGRVTVAGVLAQDPSLTVTSATPGGNH
jgi:hypothetical protein